MNIIKPETKCTVDADIIEHISNLCTDIKNIIEKTRDRELKFIKTNLSIIDDIENNTTFYIRQELFSEYIINLQNTNSICLINIILSQQNFLQYLYNYRSKLDFIPYKLNIIETEWTLTIFLIKTLKILKEGISTHKEQLNKKYPTSEKPLSYKDEKLSSIIYLYGETFLKLLNLVPSLEKEMNNTPPFQNPVSPKKENSYESLINTMNNTPVYCTYEYLFNSFYNRLTYLNSNNKTTPLWHILHIYISTHIKKMKRILKLPQ